MFKRWVLQGEPYQVADSITQETILTSLQGFAKDSGVDLMTCTFNMARWSEEATRAIIPEEAVEPFGTYLLDISTGMASIEAGMRGNFRRSLKKARNEQPRITTSVPVAEFMDLLSTSYGQTGRAVPFSRAYFDGLLNRPAIRTVCVGIYTAEGRLDATGLAVYDDYRGYYLHGAARRDGLHGAAILLQCELMERLIEAGVPRYDLGGARLETDDKRLAGIAAFKRRFGGEYEPVGRFQWPISRRGRFFELLKKRFS